MRAVYATSAACGRSAGLTDKQRSVIFSGHCAHRRLQLARRDPLQQHKVRQLHPIRASHVFVRDLVAVQLREQGFERENVGTRAVGTTARDRLRRQPATGADAGGHRALIRAVARDAKVRQLGAHFRVQQHVAGLEVAMHEWWHERVHVHERFGDADGDLELVRSPLFRNGWIHEVRAQVAAVHALEERLQVGLAEPRSAQKLDDVWVLESRHQLNLGDESLRLGFRDVAFAKALGRHELRVAELDEPDVAIRPASELLDVLDVVYAHSHCLKTFVVLQRQVLCLVIDALVNRISESIRARFPLRFLALMVQKAEMITKTIPFATEPARTAALLPLERGLGAGLEVAGA